MRPIAIAILFVLLAGCTYNGPGAACSSPGDCSAGLACTNGACQPDTGSHPVPTATPSPKATATPSSGATATPTTPPAPEMATADVMVSVPYWTAGDVYLGIEGDDEYLKLAKVNEFIYNGTATLEKGAQYHYYSNARETGQARAFGSGRVFDSVTDWEGSTKAIGKPGFQKGFYLGACHTCGVSYSKGNFIGPMRESMDLIKQDGGTWVNIVPLWFVLPDYTGSEIKPLYGSEFTGTSGWLTATMTDEDLRTMISDAHERGLKVYLVPHIGPVNWGPDIKGKGDLEPKDTIAFFESYTTFITHYAEIAEETGVEMFSIGNELDSLTMQDIPANSQIDKTANWRQVISAVRKEYTGVLTYSCSCTDEERCGPQVVKFWDDLDVIGWEWYVPIATKAHEPIASMKANAERIINNNIEPMYKQYNKPIVFTEIGWEAYPGACANTYGNAPSKGGDRVEQSACYEAVFQAIEDERFIQGMHIWTWTANNPGDELPWVNTDSANEVRFSITEKEIAKWYWKMA